MLVQHTTDGKEPVGYPSIALRMGRSQWDARPTHYGWEGPSVMPVHRTTDGKEPVGCPSITLRMGRSQCDARPSHYGRTTVLFQYRTYDHAQRLGSPWKLPKS